MSKNTVNVKTGNTQVAKVSTTKADRSLLVKDLIKYYEEDIKRALPSVITPERFTRIALTAIVNNDKLLASTQSSIMGSLFVAAQLGLEVNTPLGQAWLIPYNNRKNGTIEATFQLGYKGLLDLAYRSGEIKSISAHVVYEKDFFQFELGLNPVLKHIPALGDRGKRVRVYGVYQLLSGGYDFEVMSVEDINKHRNQYSKAADSDAWKDSWDSMAKKTVLIQALKYAPMKSDFLRATVMDEQRYIVKETTVGSERIVDVVPDYEYQDTPFEEVKEEPKKPSKKEDPKPVEAEVPTEDEIEAGMPDFLKDTN